MIVTCESCQAKYKLDDAKITGRGAKITCPKCRHVFVVYTAGGQPAAAAATASAASRVTAPPPAPFSAAPPPSVTAPDPDAESWEEDEPTRIGMASVPAPSRRPGIAGLPQRPDAGRRSNPTLALPDPAEHNVAFLPPPPPANSVTVSPAAMGDAASRAASLDFKRVGVATWKVKVKIGLIYDFSDIKTLRKYIQDGRVTASDSISYDGRAWKALGEIPDLDTFFVETWERLNRQRAEQAPPVAPEMPPPSRPLGMTSGAGPVETPRRAEETPKPGPEPTQFRDPFEELKSKQRERVAGRRTAAPTPASTGTSPWAIVGGIAVLAALGVGGWYVWRQQDGGAVPDRPVTTLPKPATATTPTDIREQIQNQLKEGMQKVPDTEPAVAPPPDPHELTPVRPTNIPAGATPVKSGAEPRSSTTGTSTTGKSGQPINTSDATATDHEAIGDASARAGDWAGAVKAYSNAVALDPKNGRLLKKLGEAQSKAGDKDAAAETLKRAAAEGQRDAYKLLGNIAREQGDTSNAVYQYQLYLAGHPKDSAEIEKLIQEMSGGG